MNQKLIDILAITYSLFMLVLAIIFYKNNESFKFLISLSGVFCGIVPLILAFIFKFKSNIQLVFFYLLFLFCSQYLGSIRGWYGLGWWDILLHFLSGILIAYLSVALYERLIHRAAGKMISPWFVFLFIFAFSVFGGVLWEFYEFSMDQFFDMTLQGGGNKDTMVDLIADTTGGLLVATWSVLKLKI
ncbi:MAG: hypothetical protein K0S34_283 [Bacillales bacterium]|jgi:hypothetical protein|nr:hypothetical protein [Bacillales bacterium]